MANREISIGRSSSCDISLGESAEYASSFHGTIFMNGTQLMYKDMSTNGTIINNMVVNNNTVPINHGDTILIAGKYPISWGQIDALLSPSSNTFHQTKILNSDNMMYCNKCGTPVNSGSSYCPKCGCPLGANANSYNQYQQAAQQHAYQAYQQPQQHPFKPNSNMVWAILTTLCCCVPTGIYAIILASKVDGLYYAERFDEAREASNGALIWSVISCALGIFSYFILAVLL